MTPVLPRMEPSDDLLAGLTPSQRQAVTHVDGPLLILAGPGSGKTRVVTHRVAYLLRQGIAGRNILALTFTNKAADEMRSRVERLWPGHAVWLGTFHRFCARLLRQHARLVGLESNYTIYDADDSLRTLRRVIGREKIDLGSTTPEAVASAISWAKNNLIVASDYRPRPGYALAAVVAGIYPAYQAQLLRSNAVDFDDLLLHAATILRDNPELRQDLDERYRYILVDEYQDTNLAQYAIVRALSVEHPHLAVTGDPDQSIYGWRGANLHNILEFEKDFPDVKVVRLERNYRSTKRILRVASELIRHNVKRKQKELYTENGEGAPVVLVQYASEKDEAEQIAAQIAQAIRGGRRRARDFAVFYRVNALSRAFEFALRDAGVPYQLVHGLEFFQRKEIKDVLAYLQLVNNPRNDEALLRVINTPTRGIGKAAVEQLQQHATRRNLSLLEAARDVRNAAGLSKRSVGPIEQFVAMFERLMVAAGACVEEIVGLVLEESGYQERLKSSDDEADQDRLANIQEMLTVARQFDERLGAEGGLEAFLEQTSLTSDTDELDSSGDWVTLMTLHASKGLEFPVVYLVAAEQGLLPHDRSRHHPDQLEEERRLMFVGITRAQQELRISLAQYRDFRGQRKRTIPSEFLMELPRYEMEIREMEAEAEPWEEDLPVIDRAPSPLSSAAATGNGFLLTTAAELAGGEAASASVSASAFHHGMLVRHPNYGLGHIVALSGSGASRRATVDFVSDVGRMKFVLEKSPLRPVRSAEGGA